MKRFGAVEVHPHESAKPQIIASLGFPRIIKFHFPVSIVGILIRRVQAPVTKSISFSIQRIDEAHLFRRHHVGTRKERGKKQYTRYYIYRKTRTHFIRCLFSKSKSTNISDKRS